MIFIEILVKNLRINYEYINKEKNKLRGNGRTILILPGWGTNIDVYRVLIEDMSLYSNVIAIDMPGFGKSELPKEAWDIDGYIDFIESFVKELGIKELDLIGHSNGGRLIIKMMSKENIGFKVGKIILMGSAGIVHKKSLKTRIKVRLYKVGKTIMGCKIVKKIVPNALEQLQKKVGSEDYKNAPPILRQSMVKLINEDMREYLPNINVPTLLLWGENDTATPIDDAKIMEKLIPDTGLVVIPGGTHFVFLEQPAYINKIISTFLAEDRG